MSDARIDDLVAKALIGTDESNAPWLRSLLDEAYTRGWTDSLDELGRRMDRKTETAHG